MRLGKEIISLRQQQMEALQSREDRRLRNLYIRSMLTREQNFRLNAYDAGEFDDEEGVEQRNKPSPAFF